MSSRKIAPPPRRKRVRRTSGSPSLIVEGEKTRKRSAQVKSALDNRFHRTDEAQPPGRQTTLHEFDGREQDEPLRVQTEPHRGRVGCSVKLGVLRLGVELKIRQYVCDAVRAKISTLKRGAVTCHPYFQLCFPFGNFAVPKDEAFFVVDGPL